MHTDKTDPCITLAFSSPPPSYLNMDVFSSQIELFMDGRWQQVQAHLAFKGDGRNYSDWFNSGYGQNTLMIN